MLINLEYFRQKRNIAFVGAEREPRNWPVHPQSTLHLTQGAERGKSGFFRVQSRLKKWSEAKSWTHFPLNVFKVAFKFRLRSQSVLTLIGCYF